MNRLEARARIRVPDLPPGAITRSALLERIDAALGQGAQVLTVSAPAGFGKTTVLAQWAGRVATAGSPVAWLTANDADADPARLFADLRDAFLVALEACAPKVAEQLAELAWPTGAAVESELDTLAMALDELDPPLTLVIDDVQVGPGVVAPHALEAFALRLPGTVRLALGSRAEPRPLLTGLRLRADVVEVTAQDLALTDAQVAELLQRAGVHEPDAAAALFAQTEGWPAAVRLGVLAFRAGRGGEVLPLVYDPSVSDFLTREIEAALPADALALLRDTAVLPELTPQLAAELGGRPDAGDLLEGLFRAQALVRRAGTGEPVYVVHSLLRSHLLSSLAAADASAPARQHAAAARLLAARGLLERALDQALEAGDPDLTSELLRGAGPRLLTAARAPTLLRALATLSPQRWDRDVAGLAALARADTGDLPGAELALALADRIAADDGVAATSPMAGRRTSDVPELWRVAQFVVRRLRAGLAEPAVSESLGDVLAWRPTPTPAERDLDRQLLLLVNRGQWQFATGRYDGAWEDLRLALDLATTHRRDGIELRALSTLAAVPALVGQAADTDRYVGEVLDRIERRGWATHPSMANVYAAGAWAASLMLLPQRAEQLNERAQAALRGNVDPEYATYAAVVDATLQADRPGDPAAAMALLAVMAQGGAAAQLTPRLRAFAAMQRVRIMLKHGDVASAEAAVADLQRWVPGTGDARIAQAQVHAVRGRWAQCLAELRVVQDRALPIHVPIYQVVHPMLTAVARERLSQHPAAIEALGRSLDVAAPRGTVRPYWEAGPPMRAMLLGLRGRLPGHDGFVGTILERWEAADRLASGRPTGIEVEGVVLTQRELQVLRELPTLMTAQELAEAQLVSVNTIRTHMRALYRKLGVRTRRDAVRRGRELGLL